MSNQRKIKTLSRREWRQKSNPDIHAHQAYHWVDRVLYINEAKGRLYTGEATLEEFLKSQDWELVKDWEYED